MPGEERHPFYPEAGAVIFDRFGRLLLVRYRDEPYLWSAPRLPIGFGHEPEDDAVLAALNHACAEVEVLGEPWFSDYRVPEQGIHLIAIWYECIHWGWSPNRPDSRVLEHTWAHPGSVLFHPLMIPTAGQTLPLGATHVARLLRPFVSQL
jgi:hypothetical protein